MAVSTISGSAMPSTATSYLAPILGIHAAVSRHCSSLFDGSKPHHSARLSASVATAPASATWRTSAGRDAGSISTLRPVSKGRKIVRLSMAVPSRVGPYASSQKGQASREQDQQRPDEQAQRVQVKFAALQGTDARATALQPVRQQIAAGIEATGLAALAAARSRPGRIRQSWSDGIESLLDRPQ